jgi:hypothetical protein
MKMSHETERFSSEQNGIALNNQEGKSLDELTGEGTFVNPTTDEEIMKPKYFKDGVFGMRSDIELIKSAVKNWMEHPDLLNADGKGSPLSQKGEMIANLKLAYRHLEDARMRLGKVVQAYDGGKSCYPK